MMPPGVRKLALAAHLTVSTGWIGGVVAYLVLGVAAATAESRETLRAVWIAMDLTGWYAIVPLAVASLVTGIIMAVGTRWGLFRHYWVIFSFAFTVLATVVLLLHMPEVSALADVARATGASGGEAVADADRQLGQGDLLHPGLGLVVLLVVQVLNVYKPPGLTPYGQRKQAWERSKS